MSKNQQLKNNRHQSQDINNNNNNNDPSTAPPPHSSATLSSPMYKSDDLTNKSNRSTDGLLNKLSNLYMNDTLADVYFLVCTTMCEEPTCRQSERIPAHKLILSLNSPVFNAMFYGSGQFMNQTNNEIEITDIELAPFKNLLKFLYTDRVSQIEPDNVMATLYAAKKYSVLDLELECVNYLKDNLKAENVFMIVGQARLFDEHNLVVSCLDIIDKYAAEAFESDCFLDIDFELLNLVLKRDTLDVKESKLFEYVIKWAKCQCVKRSMDISRENVQSMLGDAVGLIRFPLMNRQEFALAMSSIESRVLKDEQIIEMFIKFSLNNPKNGSEFQSLSRCSHDTSKIVQSINRFTQIESRWGYSGASDRIKFRVNKRILIVGVSLYGSIYGVYEYHAHIQLIHHDTCNLMTQNHTAFSCDGTNSTFKVLFKEPVEIDSDTDYVVTATLKGPDSFYGTKGLKTVSHESNGNSVTFSFQHASGNNNGSSVDDGQIPEILFIYI